MAFRHCSVLTQRVVHYLAPHRLGCYVDATVGGGGHAEAILDSSSPTGRLLGIDRDPVAIEVSRARLARFGDRVELVRSRYGRLTEILAERNFGNPTDETNSRIDGLVVDAGLSSIQLDDPNRGFSFQNDGPLDMRMSNDGESCADLLDRLEPAALAKILRQYGEVSNAGVISKKICAARGAGKLETTHQLAELVEENSPHSRRRIHPATTVFQALRVAVNRELDDLKQLCNSFPGVLKRSGVAVFIAFHSLEDRIIKHSLKRHSRGPEVPAGVPLTEDQLKTGVISILTKRPIRPQPDETERNPRARSARLRAAQRLSTAWGTHD